MFLITNLGFSKREELYVTTAPNVNITKTPEEITKHAYLAFWNAVNLSKYPCEALDVPQHTKKSAGME
jgi:hypothetical protein